MNFEKHLEKLKKELYVFLEKKFAKGFIGNVTESNLSCSDFMNNKKKIFKSLVIKDKLESFNYYLEKFMPMDKTTKKQMTDSLFEHHTGLPKGYLYDLKNRLTYFANINIKEKLYRIIIGCALSFNDANLLLLSAHTKLTPETSLSDAVLYFFIDNSNYYTKDIEKDIENFYACTELAKQYVRDRLR